MPRFLPSFGGAPLPLSWVSLGDSGRWVVQAPAIFLGSSLSFPVVAAGLRWLRFILGCPPSVASLWRLLPWFFVRYLLAPGSCGVPSLHVRSLISGLVCVLPQSTIVTLLSLLWLDLLLIFVRFHYLRLSLWASACGRPHGCPAFSRVGADPSTWIPLLWPG